MILLYYTLTRAIVWEGRVIMQRPQIKRLLVREVAETRGMSLDDVSRYSGEKYPTVRSIWYGHVRNPQIQTLFSIARALKVSIEELIEVEAEGTSPEEKLQTPALVA
jgi:transcriptional regulator with XRE-family HTH domain